ncbi:MAG: ATP-binding protein, partial [Pseudomonadota bacterium]|nr:ATP-binding protein [Pseudomonadota bacterium]
VLIHTLNQSGLQIIVDVPPDLPPVLVDRGELETVLVNLATNARDAMPHGGELRLSARLEAIEDEPHPAVLRPGQYICLSAADTGAGMSAETLARASEPFFTTKPEGEGTGLGLAMAREFAQLAGGGFSLASTPDVGTTVSLWLPVLDPASATTSMDEAA